VTRIKKTQTNVFFIYGLISSGPTRPAYVTVPLSDTLVIRACAEITIPEGEAKRLETVKELIKYISQRR